MQAMSKFRKWMLIIALLAFNIVEQSTSATSSTVSLMAKSFPAVSQANIQMVTTIGAIFTTIFVFVSGIVSNRVGQKKIAILGVTIATLASLVPALSNNFMVILASRALMGVGIGLANPLAISMIGEFFEGDELNNLMGWRSAIASVGSSLMTMIAGFLMAFNWHAAYWAYLLFIPALLLMIFFIPNPETAGLQHKQAAAAVSDKQTKKLPANARLQIIGLAVVLFFVMATVMTIMLNLALMYVQRGIGTPTQASTTLSIWSMSQLIGGVFFGLMYKHMGKWVFPIGIFFFGITFALTGFVASQTIIYLLMLLNGILGGTVIPYIYTRIAELSDAKTAPFNNAIALIGSNISAFLSPYFGAILGGTSAMMAVKNAGFLSVGLALVIAIVFMVNTAKTSHHKESIQ